MQENTDKITLDRLKFINYVFNSLEVEKILSNINVKRKKVKYKKVSKCEGMKNIFQFIGVENIYPKWLDLEKINPEPQKYIKNYRSLRMLEEEAKNIYEKGSTKIEVIKRYKKDYLRHIVKRSMKKTKSKVKSVFC